MATIAQRLQALEARPRMAPPLHFDLSGVSTEQVRALAHLRIGDDGVVDLAAATAEQLRLIESLPATAA